ncbi:MAG: dCTP deaminase [Desulfomonilaceae bacterium]
MFQLMTGEAIIALTTKLISAKKQQGAFSLDLTVSEIRKIDHGGALDFGGSEFQEASTTLLKADKKSAEEPYGWWKLEQGHYLIKFNEKFNLKNRGLVLIFPHERLLAAGGSHPCVTVEDPHNEIQVLLIVGIDGLAIKENARVSKALVLAAGS